MSELVTDKGKQWSDLGPIKKLNQTALSLFSFSMITCTGHFSIFSGNIDRAMVTVHSATVSERIRRCCPTLCFLNWENILFTSLSFDYKMVIFIILLHSVCLWPDGATITIATPPWNRDGGNDCGLLRLENSRQISVKFMHRKMRRSCMCYFSLLVS